jgi:hypothetical protein
MARGLSRRLLGAALTIVIALALAGCLELDGELVASHVKAFEGDGVDVRSCEKVGDAITQDEHDGATLHEAWKCSVNRPDATSAFIESCYVVYNEGTSGVIRGLPCASVGRGCPPGGRQLRGGQVFLGPIIDPELVYEQELGNEPAHRTFRFDVAYENPKGTQEHCGYLDVRVLAAADDPLELAAEHVERRSFTSPRYTVVHRSTD